MRSKTVSGKRVLMLLQNAPYPHDERVRREAGTLLAAGYRVSVISPATRKQSWRETLDGVGVYRFPAPPAADGFLGYLWEYGYSMAAIFALALFVLLREGFDIVHANQPPDTFAFVAGFFKLLGKRYVFDHHDLAPELYYARFRGKGNRPIYQLLVWLERLSCNWADRVIATNHSYKTIEMQRGCVPEQRITIVRNGPQLRELNCSLAEPPGPALRRDGRTVIGYAGVTGTQDGVDYLLRALQHLICDLERKDFTCIVVGSGDALPGLKSLVAQLGLTDYVSFTGWIDDPEEYAHYLEAMDICIAPEPSDDYNDRSTAAKVMEYMALAKPVVAFDLPEHRFTAQAAALYARPNDELDLARQIITLMDDPERCRQLGRIGRKRIEDELSWQHQAVALRLAYDSVVQPRDVSGAGEP